MYTLQETFGTNVHRFNSQKDDRKQKQGFGNQNNREEECELFVSYNLCVLFIQLETKKEYLG